MTTVPPARGGVAVPAAHAILASVVGLGVSFVTSVATARILGPAAKGTFDLATATAALLALVLGFALPTGITFAVARGYVSARPVALASAGLAMLQVLGASLLLWLANDIAALAAVVGSGFADATRLLIAVLVGVMAFGANVRAVAVGRLMVPVTVWVELAGRALTLVGILAVGVLLGSGPGAADRILLVVLGGALVTAAGFLRITLRGSGAEAGAMDPAGAGSGRASLRRRLGLGVALPSYVANVLQFLNYRLDLFFVAALRSTADVGVYALAATLAQMVWLLSNGVAAALFPSVAAAGGRAGGTADAGRATAAAAALSATALDAAARTSTLSRIALASSLVVGLGLGISAIVGLGLVFGAAYLDAVPAIWLLLPGIVAFAPANVLAAHLAGQGRASLNLVASALSLLVTVVLDLALIPPWGIRGAAVASSASYMVATAVIIALYSRHARQPVRSVLVLQAGDLRLAARVLRSLRSRLVGDRA